MVGALAGFLVEGRLGRGGEGGGPWEGLGRVRDIERMVKVGGQVMDSGGVMSGVAFRRVFGLDIHAFEVDE